MQTCCKTVLPSLSFLEQRFVVRSHMDQPEKHFSCSWSFHVASLTPHRIILILTHSLYTDLEDCMLVIEEANRTIYASRWLKTNILGSNRDQLQIPLLLEMAPKKEATKSARRTTSQRDLRKINKSLAVASGNTGTSTSISTTQLKKTTKLPPRKSFDSGIKTHAEMHSGFTSIGLKLLSPVYTRLLTRLAVIRTL